MGKWLKIKLFHFKIRNNVYFSNYIGHNIRVVKIYDWDDWVWEIVDSSSNNRFGNSDYDVRSFVKGEDKHEQSR